jgi:hypothetical protein
MMELYSAEALLEDKERICLAGYLLLKEHDDKALLKAYVYSRSSPPQSDGKKLLNKAQQWLESPKVQAFLTIWQQQGKMMSQEARMKMQVEGPPADDQEQISATEEIIREYEKLRDEAEDVMDKARITTMIVNARHKNKEEVKDDTRTTRIYLPQRCSECVLYKKEQEKIL